eukprot:Nk52_evm2s406 gene=Nk52_evmTU2s406
MSSKRKREKEQEKEEGGNEVRAKGTTRDNNVEQAVGNNNEEWSHSARKLTEEEISRLKKDKIEVPEFWKKKYKSETSKNWDLFYKRNQTNFYKDRHWTTREFTDLVGDQSSDKESNGSRRVLLEVGCGVGNFFFPLVEEKLDFEIYCCDLSKRGIEFIKKHKLYDAERIHPFVCDVTTDTLNKTVGDSTVDIATMIFILSAVEPEKMKDALAHVARTLKPGGLVLFRDYGLFDHAMLRFNPGHKMGDRFYVRQDGTFSYYFGKVEELKSLMADAGLEEEQCEYVVRETVNKKEGIKASRIFVQGKFRKKL